jgi:hypothetical protein
MRGSALRILCVCGALWLGTGPAPLRAQPAVVATTPGQECGPSSIEWLNDTTISVVEGRSGTRSRWKVPVDSAAAVELVGREPLSGPLGRDAWETTSPDGQWIARGSPWLDRVWVTRGPVVTELVDVPVATAACWSRDSQTLFLATDNPLDEARRIRWWNTPAKIVRSRTSRPELEFPARGTSNVAGIVWFTRPGKVDDELVAFTHLVPKSRLPSTQIEQGWVFTNALTIVDWGDAVPRGRLVPLDTRTRGFANPSGVTASPDGKWLYVAHDGAEVVSVVDVERVLAEVTPQPLTSREAPTGLYDAPDLTRTRRLVPKRWTVSAPGSALAVSPDGSRLAVAHPREDRVSILDTSTGNVLRLLELAEGEPPQLVRRGETLFHSGRLSYGGQFSCASCHPRGHTDGLSWDLPADGFNNFQNTKSLLDAAGTAPYGWHGGSATLRERFSGTLQGLFQYKPTEDESLALAAYLESLRAPPRGPPEPTPGWTRGRELFGTAGCATCHAGPRFTDGKQHALGTSSDGDPSSGFDTPSLAGVARSGPWLHDGRANTLESIFRQHDPDGQHGGGKDLDDEELRALLEYVSSL